MGIGSQPARCSLPEAICMVANEPWAEPVDPFADQDLADDFHGNARYFLANLFAMRALAQAEDEGDPPLPNDWQPLCERLGLSSGRPSLWSGQQTWSVRVRSMRGHCADTGRSAAHWVRRWSQREAAALKFLKARSQRNQRLIDGDERLRGVVMDEDGPLVYGRNRRTGVYSKIPREVFYDPRTRVKTDPAATLYQNSIRFVNELDAPGGGYDHITLSRRAILALVSERSNTSSAPERSKRAEKTKTRTAQPPMRRGKLWAAQQAILAAFPNGFVAGMLEPERNARINAELLRLGSAAVSDRTIRSAAALLRMAGRWPG